MALGCRLWRGGSGAGLEEEDAVFPITNYRAFWHPGLNAFGIEIRLADARSVQLQINTPEEFIAVLAVLNGPGPVMTPQGHVVCQR
jgi:hypothetical protein